MRVLITGGAGFIGSNLVKHHIASGDSVVVIDNLSTGKKDNLQSIKDHSKLTVHYQDLTTWDGLEQALQGVDRVYHLAAVVGMFHVLEHPIETLNVNTKATFRLFETIHTMGIKPLVLVASSSEIYGNQHAVLSETSPLILEGSMTSHAAYAISKLTDESIALSYWHKQQIPCCVLRIFNTVGANQRSRYGMVIPRFVAQAINNEAITVFGSGEQRRAFCDVRDTVQLVMLLANNPASVGEIVNMGNTNEITINALAELVKNISNSSSEIIHIPFEEVYHNDSMNIAERLPDLTKLIRLTGYTYQWTLEQTIRDIIAVKRNIQ